MVQKRTSGFTLLEILIVIVIVSIMAAAIVLGFSSNSAGRQLEKEAQRLMEVMRLVSESALDQGKVLGIVFDQHHYQVMRWVDGVPLETLAKETTEQPQKTSTEIDATHVEVGHWVPETGERAYRRYSLPETMTMDLQIEGASVVLNESSEQANDETDGSIKPALLALPGGETTAFKLIFSMKNAHAVQQTYAVVGDELGQLSLKSSNEDAP